MSRRARIVLIVALAIASTTVLAVGAGAVYVYRDGMIDVHVQEKEPGGTAIHVMVPTVFVRVVLAFVPLSPDMRPGPEVRPWWPVVEAASSAIAGAPDGVFVQVDGPDEHVRIAKEDGRLVVDVDDTDARVRVSVPVRAVEYVVRRIRPGESGWCPRARIRITASTRAPVAPPA